MRHIPEDELHSYLDQALSRSQCIEIETHLARCGLCRDGRDEIAALRDRTTALLARVVSRRPTPPSYATLMARAYDRRRANRRRPALLAASVAGLLFAGWATRAMLDREPTTASRPQTVARVEPAALQPDPTTLAPIVVDRQPSMPLAPGPGPVPAEHGPSTGLAEAAPASDVGARPDPPGQTISTVAVVPVQLALDDWWTTTTLGEAEETTHGLVPLIPDLPVMRVQIRRGSAQERPLIIVTQRHPGGGEVFTVEGPVAEVAEVVSSQLTPDLQLNSSEPSRSQPDYIETGSGFQRTSRVLAVLGRLPVDSLNALVGTVVLR